MSLFYYNHCLVLSRDSLFAFYYFLKENRQSNRLLAKEIFLIFLGSLNIYLSNILKLS